MHFFTFLKKLKFQGFESIAWKCMVRKEVILHWAMSVSLHILIIHQTFWYRVSTIILLYRCALTLSLLFNYNILFSRLLCPAYFEHMSIWDLSHKFVSLEMMCKNYLLSCTRTSIILFEQQCYIHTKKLQCPIFSGQNLHVTLSSFSEQLLTADGP